MDSLRARFVDAYDESANGSARTYAKAMAYEPLWDVNNGRVLCDSCHKMTATYKVGKSIDKQCTLWG